MAKCTETCPKCGAGRTQFEGQTSWKCGSYQSLIGGSHIRTPQFKLIEGEHCKTRQALAARESELAEAQQRLSEIANAQRNACTTECIDGVWWAKGSGIVAGPQATEQDVLLEVAENWWRVNADRITHIPGKEDDDGEMH